MLFSPDSTYLTAIEPVPTPSFRPSESGSIAGAPSPRETPGHDQLSGHSSFDARAFPVEWSWPSCRLLNRTGARLRSLDIFRGLAVASMILVECQG